MKIWNKILKKIIAVYEKGVSQVIIWEEIILYGELSQLLHYMGEQIATY